MEAQRRAARRPASAYRASILALAVLGVVLPWQHNLAYFLAGGSVAPADFFGSAFANELTTAITLDVYLAALTFAVWVGHDEGAPRRRWLYVLACFAIGLSFALPLYLLMRQPRAQAAAREQAGRGAPGP
ncbi:DUF2834 domain-containing protein [Caldimonas tepidiphila]|uniref:DUF2834 domain-containing protein n=1 Tax=Caldimonas tepidiphila TaxID=2315841 RepID=UPI000E5BF428|nr:DUF2834 domain-containing protein [Caldimonas tepidiphila]